jgi:hypothetical protein
LVGASGSNPLEQFGELGVAAVNVADGDEAGVHGFAEEFC